MFFFHTHTHARTHVVARRRKYSKIFFFVPLFIYILEDLKLIVFIFTLTFDKTFFFLFCLRVRFRESETNLNFQAIIFSIWSVEIYLLNYLPPFFLGQNLLYQCALDRQRERKVGSEKRERNINCHLGSLWIRISRDDSRLKKARILRGEGI